MPLHFDAERLSEEVRAFDTSCWRLHPQKFAGNFALPLISVNGNPDVDAINGPMGPTPYLKQCPYLTQVLHRIGAVWGRTRLMKLSGHAEVTPHADVSYYWRERTRVHVPIVTKPTVRFICGEAEVNMAAGECWIFDTWRVHQVINTDGDERIHLVADTVGSDGFWDLVSRGRAPGHAGFESWREEAVAATSEVRSELAYESVNVPVVMTPWELQEHLIFLLGEVHPHQQLASAQRVASQFIAKWKPLWMQYGTARSGWPFYRETLNAFEHAMEQVAAPLTALNGVKVMNILRPMLLDVAIADSGKDVGAYEPRKPVMSGPRAAVDDRDEVFDRPVFIVSPPRSGSTLLFETLAQAPGLFTIGQESHALIEGIQGLHPKQYGFDSNQLDPVVATPALSKELRDRFLAELRDREGRPAAQRPVRLLEKTPKNSLRVPFLMKVFPEARFVYLHRDPRQTLSSMIEAWQSGRFRMYPDLPGWNGLPWSLLLVPGWRELIGLPLQKIVAAQWETTTRILLDDLEALAPGRCHVARYDAFLVDPAAEMTRLCGALELEWDRSLDGVLPLSRYTVTEPASDKWRRHEELIEQVVPDLQATLDRAERFAAR
ncbi:sulfotransferase [Rhodanobacter sp. C03]|uniref:sulfotransferase n=1 Tax=Rhodanobacter sp. C03 TaxID=1945858 RepID=UPI00143C8F97|nr:sulfotransferase [Rhodanobacter sp. C03]